MFMVHYTNFNYGHDGFDSLETALTHARKVGFEAAIYDDKNRLVATYHPLRGVEYKESSDV